MKACLKDNARFSSSTRMNVSSSSYLKERRDRAEHLKDPEKSKQLIGAPVNDIRMCS